MSGGIACKDKIHRAAGEWVIVQDCRNFSAFNGYRETPSDYSAIKCLRCGKVWRTKAGYVSTLRRASDEEIMRPV